MNIDEAGFEYSSNIRTIVEYIKSVDVIEPVFIDIETEGLYVTVVTVQLYQEKWQKAKIAIVDDVSLAIICEAIKEWHIVGSNIAYELGTLLVVPRKVDDVMLLAKYSRPDIRDFALDSLARTYSKLGKRYDVLNKKVIRKNFKRGEELSADKLEYAALDVLVLPDIYNDPNCQKERANTAYIINMQALMYAAKYQQNPLIVDRTAVKKELEKIAPELEAKAKLLPINYNSPKQVCSRLGIPKSDKDALIAVISEGGTKGEEAKLVYEARRLSKRKSLLESYDFESVTTRFSPYGTTTGRFSSSSGDIENGINSQQIPRDLQYIFEMPTEDTSIIHSDFSTAELRAAASIMKEPVMYGELKMGIDLHKAAASMARGIPIESVTKAQRQEGKAISFGLIFGMSAPKFVQYAFTNYGVTFSLEDARNITRKYKNKYQAIALYHNYWYKNVSSIPVMSALGHRAFARTGTDAINFATQATIAETTKLSIHYLVKSAPETLNMIYNVVHDAIFMRVPAGKEEHYTFLLESAMQKGWENICRCSLMYYKDIPMPVETDIITKDNYAH